MLAVVGKIHIKAVYASVEIYTKSKFNVSCSNVVGEIHYYMLRWKNLPTSKFNVSCSNVIGEIHYYMLRWKNLPTSKFNGSCSNVIDEIHYCMLWWVILKTSYIILNNFNVVVYHGSRNASIGLCIN